MASITLDKSRPFGVVFPPEGAHFYQDGFYFTHGGELVEDMLDDEATKKLKRREASAAAEKRRDEIYREELAKQGLDEGEISEAIAEQKATNAEVVEDPKAVDLVAWAKGQRKYVFGQVRKAFADQYGFAVADKRNGIEFLIDNGKIVEDDVAI